MPQKPLRPEASEGKALPTEDPAVGSEDWKGGLDGREQEGGAPFEDIDDPEIAGGYNDGVDVVRVQMHEVDAGETWPEVADPRTAVGIERDHEPFTTPIAPRCREGSGDRTIRR